MNREQLTVVALGVAVLLVFGAGAATVDSAVAGSGSSDRIDGERLDEKGGEPPTDRTDGVFAHFDDRYFRQVLNGSGEANEPAERSGADPDRSVVTTPEVPTAGLALLGIVVVVAALLVTRRSTTEPVDPTPDDSEADGSALAGVGTAAGVAADRLADDAAPENAVARAWLDMTRYLDVENPGSTTPGEFARAGVEAGMRREDVAALTDAFEQVRYGGAPASEERERAAREAFRRIEARYADGGRDGAPDHEASEPSGGGDE